jgi:hypothetical protein
LQPSSAASGTIQPKKLDRKQNMARGSRQLVRNLRQEFAAFALTTSVRVSMRLCFADHCMIFCKPAGEP